MQVTVEKLPQPDVIELFPGAVFGDRVYSTVVAERSRMQPKNATLYPHYFKDVTALTHVDVYRVLALFNVTDPCLQHAVKKLLLPGCRGDKASVSSIDRDVQEALHALERWKEMRLENSTAPQTTPFPPIVPPAPSFNDSSKQRAHPAELDNGGR